MLRAVGHVLQKVDGEEPTLKIPIREAYNSWKMDPDQHAIFWEFIEKERNNILKNYKFDMHPLEEVGIVCHLNLVNVQTGEPYQLSDIAMLDQNVYRPSLDGFRSGDDLRDIYSDALKWWEAELTKIDVQAERKS